MFTENDIAILRAVTLHYVLNRRQLQQLVFPSDRDGRHTRRRLQILVDGHFINRQGVLIAHDNQSAAPVYYPSKKGCEFLAEYYGDERFLRAPTLAPIAHHTQHWLAVSDTHIALNKAVEGQPVSIEDWLNEWDIVNKDETAPEKRFCLYTLLREKPRLVCAPDAAFQLCSQGHRKVFYLEQDRATSGVNQIAASKTAGYAMMADHQFHRRHYPTTTVPSFAVLMIAPTPHRRDALRRALKDKVGAPLWRFAAVQDLVPTRILYEPIWHACDSDAPKTLLRRD